jgi:hypothetical protein
MSEGRQHVRIVVQFSGFLILSQRLTRETRLGSGLSRALPLKMN